MTAPLCSDVLGLASTYYGNGEHNLRPKNDTPLVTQFVAQSVARNRIRPGKAVRTHGGSHK
jgi:hypothetical protein